MLFGDLNKRMCARLLGVPELIKLSLNVKHSKKMLTSCEMFNISSTAITVLNEFVFNHVLSG